MNATLPMGDGTQIARRVRPRAVGHHRPARAHVPREHEEERLRARRDAPHSDVAHARALVRRALAGYGEERGVPVSYQAQSPVARPRAAVELARRAHAVAADHPDADRPGAQAGPAGAVDAVSHGGGVLPGRHSARGDLDLSRRRRRRRGGARQLRAQPDLRRHGDGRSLPGNPRCRRTVRASPRSSSATTRSTTGRSIST